MRIKICGLTRAEDAQYAHDLGAWALGFIFYPLSKRHITAAAAEKIIAQLPRDALTVGVFVNQVDEAIETAKRISLKAVQLHGDETREDCAHIRHDFSGRIIKALRPKDAGDLRQIEEYKGVVDYILIDAAVAGSYGGSGVVADWTLAVKAQDYGLPVILAGGIVPENIRDAAVQVQPHAIDLSSGVESAPGIKDKKKMDKLFGVKI